MLCGRNRRVHLRITSLLFENFFTTKPIGEGTGLGMNIVRDIIENKHHGKITFESEEGQGASFTFTIPITK